jgi:hypothetical protein
MAATFPCITAEVNASKAGPYHRALHYLDPENDPELTESPNGTEYIGSIFEDTWMKSVWYGMDDTLELPRKVNDDGTLEFTVPERVTRLSRVGLVQTLPALEVQSKHRETCRIAWTPNMAYAILVEGQLLQEDAESNPISGDLLAFYYAYNLREEAVAKHEWLLGNRPELTEFSASLPSKQVGVPHRFYFSNMKSGLIMHLNPNATLKYTVRSNLSELLRVELLVDGVWTYTPMDYKMLKDYLDDPPKELKPPQLIGDAKITTRQELALLKRTRKGTIEHHIIDILEIVSANPQKVVEAIEVKIEQKLPATGVFDVLENMKAREKNIYCNYTTNPNDARLGEDPMKISVLKYNIKRRRAACDDSIIADLFTSERYTSTPRGVGFHDHPLCERPFNIMESGRILGDLGTMLEMKLSALRDVDQSTYRVHVFIPYLRKVVYEETSPGVFLSHII